MFLSEAYFQVEPPTIVEGCLQSPLVNNTIELHRRNDYPDTNHNE